MHSAFRAPLTSLHWACALQVALHYALASPTGPCSPGSPSAASSVLLLKLRTESSIQRGASVQFLSAFPEENEVLFAPLTYLLPTEMAHVEHTVSPDKVVTVIEVAPQR